MICLKDLFCFTVYYINRQDDSYTQVSFVSFEENKDNEKMKDKKIDFVPNVIVKVTADKPLNRRNLKVC